MKKRSDIEDKGVGVRWKNEEADRRLRRHMEEKEVEVKAKGVQVLM